MAPAPEEGPAPGDGPSETDAGDAPGGDSPGSAGGPGGASPAVKYSPRSAVAFSSFAKVGPPLGARVDMADHLLDIVRARSQRSARASCVPRGGGEAQPNMSV